MGSSRKAIADFPEHARRAAGFELEKVQRGEFARDAKPMPSIGSGVYEVRVWVEAGTFRVIYVARFEEAVYVLHAFEKKTETTAQSDIKLARQRYRSLNKNRGSIYGDVRKV